jgi:hypothetical protein
MKAEIPNLLNKGVIVKSVHEEGEFISPMFLREKSDGGFRLILNLKKLNQVAEYKKFKMDTLSTILCMVRPNAFMAKLDIKDAYYSIAIQEGDQKLLKFYYEVTLYNFLVLPNGYTEGPRKFTKALKAPLAELRKRKIPIAGYIDDIFTTNKTAGLCYNGVKQTIALLDHLGFVIHPSKSVFLPTQSLEYLGFLIDSIGMTVSLTLQKKQTIREFCAKLLRAKTITIRMLATALGKFSSSFLAMPFGKLHYRNLERHKTVALRYNAGKFDKYTTLPYNCLHEIVWWKDNVMSGVSPIMHA